MAVTTLWHGEIDLPPLPRRRIKIGGNVVEQTPFLGAEISAQVTTSDVPGHDLLETALSPPFNRMLLRRKGARREATGLPALTSGHKLPEHFGNRITLAWDEPNPLGDYAATPDAVLAAWIGVFRFHTEDLEQGLSGLRPPQIGALHAIAAHFAVGTEFEPATVVLPTGTGKTETMLAAQVYCRLSRTLVLVPSDALRAQIAGKFASLGVLPNAGVIPLETARPRVAVLTTGVRDVEEAGALLREANVIVTLPHTLEACDPDACRMLIDGCSDLIVDEAHHVTAATWASVRDRFSAKRVIQFTATPFRRDGKRVDGRIIFNFKLGDAQTAGYYRPINLVTVEEYGEQDRRDYAIANAALAALRRDRSTLGLDHLLMARTRTKDRAADLLAIYAALAPECRPVVVYSGPGRTLANGAALSQILDRSPEGSRIVICVDMLGEGFDLPNLKIAALHDTHKSLAVTLQFIGRFTRKGKPDRIGEATVVTNIADPEAERKLADLYAEGADWDRIIRRLSEERVEEELRLQDVVDQLRRSGDLHAHLSLWNLRPALSTQFFRTKCDHWNPLAYVTLLSDGAETWHAYDDVGQVLVAVVRHNDRVSWGNYQNVVDVIHDLLVMRWDRVAGVLALYASDYSALRAEVMAVAVTDDRTELVTGKPIFQILNNVELPLGSGPNWNIADHWFS
jgi:superfamily II DNA or RNA helicase